MSEETRHIGNNQRFSQVVGIWVQDIHDGDQSSAVRLDYSMVEDTFLKVDALRVHSPEGEKEDVNKILHLIEDLVEGTTSKWTNRHKFHQLAQTSGQSARQFFTAAVELAR